VVDYETYCRIRDHRVRQQLTVAQTARALGLDARTVARWAEVEQFRARRAVPRASKLDAFKGQVVRWLDAQHRAVWTGLVGRMKCGQDFLVRSLEAERDDRSVRQNRR
jgi:transcriptional regulator with XRE-family HTH domain